MTNLKPAPAPDNFSSPYDELNRQIVAMLQRDGRVSFRTIADTLDVSEGTVRNRVNWMKEAGQLAIVAIVDPASITYRSDAMLGIKIASGHTPEEVAQRLGAQPQAVYILWVGGRFDLLVEVVVDTESELSEFLNAHVYKDPGIASAEIMSGIQMFKNQFLLKKNFADDVLQELGGQSD